MIWFKAAAEVSRSRYNTTNQGTYNQNTIKHKIDQRQPYAAICALTRPARLHHSADPQVEIFAWSAYSRLRGATV